MYIEERFMQFVFVLWVENTGVGDLIVVRN